MHRMFYILLSICSLATANVGEWRLVWADEFNYSGLPDSAKWGYEIGFVRNFEKQFYTKNRLKNARVENGYLIIEARKERYKNPSFNLNSTDWRREKEYAHYTSASINTQNKMQFKYGRVEVRAKLPRGKGVWPAIWALGVNIAEIGWPLCGEIDIMEFVGHDPDKIYATVHYGVGRAGEHNSCGANILAKKPYDDFHVYALEWNRDKMDFYFDQKKYYTFQIDKSQKEVADQFRKPFYLLINLALGGSWGGKIDDSIFPQQYLIDYVRIYEKNI